MHEIERPVDARKASGSESAVRGVIQRARALRGGGVVGVADEIHDEAGQAADPLALHWVPLVGHRRRTDLVLAEGLVDLLAVGEQADVGGDFVEDGGPEASSANLSQSKILE